MNKTRFAFVFACFLLITIAVPSTYRGAPPSDWPMLGGSPDRNLVSDMQGLPTEWDTDSGTNIKWKAGLGSQTYGNPVVASGKIFIGTNNDGARDPEVSGDKGILLALRESDGEFLWQDVTDKLPSGGENDWPQIGICSTPAVEGDRLYYVNNRDELMSLDTEGFLDGENDGPVTDEARSSKTDSDVVWKLDMMAELKAFPHNAANSSVAIVGDLLFVGTSNGRNESHTEVPAPDAPSLVAVNKNTGKVVWSDNSPGQEILNGQWTSPTVGTIGGVQQVVIGQGDGWVRGFEAMSGKLLWEFDTNPKDSVYPSSRNEILGTAVIWNDRVYIANGQDPENGEGEGHLFAIDGTKRGDITQTGQVWHYTEIRRSISTPAIHDGVLYIPDFSGFFHAVDALTGEQLWVHDTFAAVWGSPIVINGYVYLGDEDGDVVVLKAGRTEELVAEMNVGSAVYSVPTPANNVLFVAGRNEIFAIAQ